MTRSNCDQQYKGGGVTNWTQSWAERRWRLQACWRAGAVHPRYRWRDRFVVALDHGEASVFASVHHSVVDVGRVRDLERHEKVLDFVAVVLANTVRSSLKMTVAWVREEGSWGPTVEDRLEEVRFLGVRLEHAVG